MAAKADVRLLECSGYILKVSARTHDGHQDDEPGPNISESLDNLRFLDPLVLGSALIVSDSFYRNHTLL